MLKYIKIHKTLRHILSQQIIIREYVCTSLKSLNYLKKNTAFKILKIIPGVVAAKHVAGIRGDPCGAVR